MTHHTYRPGVPVIYRKLKHSAKPGPRARDIDPARHGDEYTYCVDKFWIVVEVRDRQVVLQTRRGKQHVAPLDDPNLRPAHWWERIFFRRRFPNSTPDSATPAA